MFTIAQAVRKILKRSPFLEECISYGIVNYSALARKIKSAVKKDTLKYVQESAILMALKRLEKTNNNKSIINQVFKNSPDMIVRSSLIEYTIANSDLVIEKYKEFLSKINSRRKYFLIITQGVFETTIIVSRDLKNQIEKILKGENIISKIDNLSSITIKLPKEVVTTPGIYHFILKTLAWEGVNIIEVASTLTEFSLILKEDDVDRAFSILQQNLSE